MRTIELNIGMENNPYADAFKGHILHKRLVHAVTGSPRYGFEVVQYGMKVGEWKGEPELTFVVVLKTDMSESEFEGYLSSLCMSFNQDAIAGTFSGKGYLVYDALYHGEKNEFSFAHFETIQKFGSNTTMTGKIGRGVGFRQTDGVIKKR
jgi:hypothetical protein